MHDNYFNTYHSNISKTFFIVLEKSRQTGNMSSKKIFSNKRVWVQWSIFIHTTKEEKNTLLWKQHILVFKMSQTWNKDHIKNVSKNSFLCSHQEQWQQAWGIVILDMYIKISVFKTKKLSTDLLGNRFRDRSLNIFKTTTGSKIS